MNYAGYNSPQSMVTVHRAFLVAVLVCALSAIAGAATQWDAPIAELSTKIISIAGPGTASLTVVTTSGFSGDQVAAIRRGLQVQLKAGGIQLRDSGASATDIKVTLAENVRSWVWIAEVQQGAETKVTMVSVPRPEMQTKTPATALTLRRVPLLSTREPLLDVALIHAGNEQFLVALEATKIALYKQLGTKVEVQQTFPIEHAAFARDLRGRIVTGREHLFDAYLPGLVCNSSSAAPITVTCRASDDAWPVGTRSALFNSARNYFTGAMIPATQKTLPPFYTIGELPRPNYTLFVFTGIDGQVLSYDGMRQMAVAGTREWGSDLAVVRSGCGIGVQVLASAAREDEGRDSLHVYEVADREPTEVGAALAFDGEIVALWPADEHSATVITRSEGRRSYDAYSVAVACGQ